MVGFGPGGWVRAGVWVVGVVVVVAPWVVLVKAWADESFASGGLSKARGLHGGLGG